MKKETTLQKIFSEKSRKFALAALTSLQLYAGAPVFAQSNPEKKKEDDQNNIITSVTVGGGPVASKHLDTAHHAYNERHDFFTARVYTNGYGNWSFQAVLPNSMGHDSIGLAYVTNPYKIPVGKTMQLELLGGIGLSTGYGPPVIPFVFGEASLMFYKRDNWEFMLTCFTAPYAAMNHGRLLSPGLVVTTPTIGVRYSF